MEEPTQRCYYKKRTYNSISLSTLNFYYLCIKQYLRNTPGLFKINAILLGLLGKETPTLGPLPLIFLPDLVTKSRLWYEAGWELSRLLEGSKGKIKKHYFIKINLENIALLI